MDALHLADEKCFFFCVIHRAKELADAEQQRRMDEDKDREVHMLDDMKMCAA